MALAGQRQGPAAEYDKEHLHEVARSFSESGWNIQDAVERIWTGERNVQNLIDGLDANSAELVRPIPIPTT